MRVKRCLATAGVKFVKDASTLLSVSADSTARIWRAGDNNNYSPVHTLKACLPLLGSLPGMHTEV